MRMNRTRKSPRKAARPVRAKKAVPAPAATDLAWVTSPLAIVTGMIFVIVVAALLTAREDSPQADLELEELPPVALAAENTSPRSFEATTTVAAKPSKTDATQAEPEAASTNHGITITGCLDADEGAFHLTDASGAEAPRSRSWKSGFLKKRPAEIELADAVGTLNLRSHTGRRVAVTGTLSDREMRARAVRVVGACE